ncbi:protein kinase [Acanthopleuribacter pedis]|uniref:Protein kinase n=1 Tax=Acanthopleuribacter pedis TaxID=442870 RepID=A0A8J7U3F0_9BACT|nr:protein kinase [Acanthopleuribacter pedis]MBO1319562.1 protein kinase [Acanthopleuribacter pedis]
MTKKPSNDLNPKLYPYQQTYRVKAVLSDEAAVNRSFLAEEPCIGKKCVLKWMVGDFPENLSEAYPVLDLFHKSLPAIFTILPQEGAHIIVREYIPADRLDACIESEPLPADRGIEVAYQIAESLAYLHENGIAHGALSSRKVLLPKDHQVKLLGFGRAGLDQTCLDADIYDFGLLFWTMLVGKKRTAQTAPGFHHQAILKDSDNLPREVQRLLKNIFTTDEDKRLRAFPKIVAKLKELSFSQYVTKYGMAGGGVAGSAKVLEENRTFSGRLTRDEINNMLRLGHQEVLNEDDAKGAHEQPTQRMGSDTLSIDNGFPKEIRTERLSHGQLRDILNPGDVGTERLSGAQVQGILTGEAPEEEIKKSKGNTWIIPKNILGKILK